MISRGLLHPRFLHTKQAESLQLIHRKLSLINPFICCCYWLKENAHKLTTILKSLHEHLCAGSCLCMEAWSHDITAPMHRDYSSRLVGSVNEWRKYKTIDDRKQHSHYIQLWVTAHGNCSYTYSICGKCTTVYFVLLTHNTEQQEVSEVHHACTKS